MNKLFTKIVGAALGLAMTIGVGVMVGNNTKESAVAQAAGTEKVAYTLTPATTGKNGYATTDGEVAISGVTWNVEGNGTIDSDNAWRLGGKNTNCNPADRRVYSKGAVSSQNITKVELTVGTASSITVNSLNLIVGGAAGGTSSVTSTVAGSFKASSTITFNRPSNADWTSKFFTFKFNLSVTAGSNKFVQIKGAKFYYEEASNFKVSTEVDGLNLSENSISGSGGTITLTTAVRKKGTNVTVTGTATKTINENVITFTSVSSDLNISAEIINATPTLGVSGQKTRFKLDEAFSFGGTVTKTYDDWVSPHTVDPVAAGNYTIDSSDFVEGEQGTYTIVVSVSGCTDFEYDVEVSNIQEKTDTLVLSSFGTVSGYNSYNASGSSTNTAYAGYLTSNSTNMQFKSKDSVSGIVNTNTKGTVKSVSITWDSSTTNGQVLDIYGSSTAYTAPSELYGNSPTGEKVGSITYGTSTSYAFTDDYEYVGIRSHNGAHYIQSISITWLVTPKAIHHIGASTVTAEGPFYVGTKPTLAELGVTVTAYYNQAETDYEDVTSLAAITYPASGLTDDNNGGDGYTISYGGKTTTVNITAEVADIYAKLNSVTDLIVGSTVRIATASYVMGTTCTGSSTQLDHIEGNAEVASLSGTANLTVSADKDGYYFSYEESSTTYYLYCKNGTDAVLGFTTTLSLDGHWNVSIASGGVADITNAQYTTRHLRSNGSTHRFACFASGQDSVSFYQLVDNDMTPAQKVAAQVDTFAKLYLHKLDILDNDTTRESDGTTCNDYYNKAKAALNDEWSPIQEDFSKDETGMWERYCDWAWATSREVPTFSGGEMQYSHGNPIELFGDITENPSIIIIVISLISLAGIGVVLYKRKRQSI